MGVSGGTRTATAATTTTTTASASTSTVVGSSTAAAGIAKGLHIFRFFSRPVRPPSSPTAAAATTGTATTSLTSCWLALARRTRRIRSFVPLPHFGADIVKETRLVVERRLVRRRRWNSVQQTGSRTSSVGAGADAVFLELGIGRFKVKLVVRHRRSSNLGRGSGWWSARGSACLLLVLLGSSGGGVGAAFCCCSGSGSVWNSRQLRRRRHSTSRRRRRRCRFGHIQLRHFLKHFVRR